MREAGLRLPVTRTKDGRRIDTWIFEMPDGRKAEINVLMHTDQASGIKFEARTQDPLFGGFTWTGTDLEELRQRVARDTSRAAEEALDDSWEPAFLIETGCYRPAAPYRKKDLLELKLAIEDIRATIAPPSNRGERPVIRNGAMTTVIERNHDTRHENDGSLSPENMRFQWDDAKSVIVVPATHEVELGLERLASMLEAFSISLIGRMSPAHPEGRTPPDGDELVELMRMAAQLDEH